MTYAALAREFGAEVRTFRSVQHAMRWWCRYVRADFTIDIVHVTCAREERDHDSDAATSALLGKCLRVADPDVDGFLLHHVAAFESWCCSLDNQEDIAEQVHMSVSGLRRTMKWTEDVLRNRMEYRGLLA